MVRCYFKAHGFALPPLSNHPAPSVSGAVSRSPIPQPQSASEEAHQAVKGYLDYYSTCLMEPLLDVLLNGLLLRYTCSLSAKATSSSIFTDLTRLMNQHSNSPSSPGSPDSPSEPGEGEVVSCPVAVGWPYIPRLRLPLSYISLAHPTSTPTNPNNPSHPTGVSEFCSARVRQCITELGGETSRECSLVKHLETSIYKALAAQHIYQTNQYFFR